MRVNLLRKANPHFLLSDIFKIMDKSLKRIGLICIVLMIPLIIGIFNPNIDQETSICPFLYVFHIPCPGCGLTKSIIHFYKGEWEASIHFHWWGGIFILIATCIIILSAYDYWKKKTYTERLLNNSKLWQAIAFFYTLTYLIRIIMTV